MAGLRMRFLVMKSLATHLRHAEALNQVGFVGVHSSRFIPDRLMHLMLKARCRHSSRAKASVWLTTYEFSSSVSLVAVAPEWTMIRTFCTIVY